MRGKSLIVTGAASGIGAAAAMLAGTRGARVTVADMDEAGAEGVAARIVEAGGEAQFVRADIASERDVEAMVRAAVERYGRLDGAFNNAGVPSFSHTGGRTPAALADMPVDGFRRTIEINLIGTFLCLRHELAAMLATGGGAIVNTASNAGILAIPNAADYIAAKHGVIGLTKAAALDYAKAGVRVNAVCPGMILTDMLADITGGSDESRKFAAESQPIGRGGEPDEIASAVIWLCSPGASLMTGQYIVLDGGMLATA